MTQYEKVIDKYWVDFLVSRNRKGQYMIENTASCFWHWFYCDFCEGSKQLAQQKWEEAQS